MSDLMVQDREPKKKKREEREEPAAEARAVQAPVPWVVLIFDIGVSRNWHNRKSVALSDITARSVRKTMVVHATNGEEAIQAAYTEGVDALREDKRDEADGHYVACPVFGMGTTQAVMKARWQADMDILAAPKDADG